MTTKTNNTMTLSSLSSTVVAPALGAHDTPPWTMAERLLRIEALGKRIAGFVDYMCQVGTLTGTSDEAKERAVLSFYERLVTVERQLARIHDTFKLE